MLYIFGKLSSSQCYAHLTCKVATCRFKIFAVKICDFGGLLGYPTKGETSCPGPISTVMQNFTLIGVTVAEISATEHIHTYIHTYNHSRFDIRQNAY